MKNNVSELDLIQKTPHPQIDKGNIKQVVESVSHSVIDLYSDVEVQQVKEPFVGPFFKGLKSPYQSQLINSNVGSSKNLNDSIHKVPPLNLNQEESQPQNNPRDPFSKLDQL